MMKRIIHRVIYIGVVLTVLFSIFSCQDDFLRKPLGSDTTVDSVFSSSQQVEAAIAQAYANSLIPGIAVNVWDGANTHMGLTGGTIELISGEINATKFSWLDGYKIQRSGMTADDGSGSPLTEDAFDFNYEAIRHNYLIIEHVDQVTDMSENEKEQIKAEMKALIAYRYEEMFKRYGGVPIVTKSFSTEDDLEIPRATLQETLDHIIKLCDEAAGKLPDRYSPQMKGRVTKGVVLAIKAEALMYAARPLFNSVAPYMSLGPEDNELISFGNVDDQSRWQQAVNANEAVLNWADDHGYEIIDTDSPLDDYGTATSIPNNSEVLLAYKQQHTSETYLDDNYSPHYQDGGANGMSYYQLQQYYKQDGTDQIWPEVGEPMRPYSEYVEKMEQMEPRYKASAIAAGIDAWNNPGDEYWSSEVVCCQSNWNGVAGTEACGRRAKFWYKAGRRLWFEYPIFRLAEFYLKLAEAHNELGEPAQALQYLNVIRDRAGLPDVTEADQATLRKIIQREWAIEFYSEAKRFFHVRHWKLEDIDSGIIGGPKKAFDFKYAEGLSFGRVAEDYVSYSMQVVYTGFWNDNQYLLPFPATEVNKGYLTQNPGY